MNKDQFADYICSKSRMPDLSDILVYATLSRQSNDVLLALLAANSKIELTDLSEKIKNETKLVYDDVKHMSKQHLANLILEILDARGDNIPSPPKCQGCLHDEPGQRAHMEHGGCLADCN